MPAATLLSECFLCHFSISLTTSSGPVGIIIRFISFSDRDFRNVSLAFLKATMVAVSPAFGTGGVDRLIGDGARSFGEGSWLTTALISMTMKIYQSSKVGRVLIKDGQEKGATELPFLSLPSTAPPSALQRLEAYQARLGHLLLSRRSYPPTCPCAHLRATVLYLYTNQQNAFEVRSVKYLTYVN